MASFGEWVSATAILTCVTCAIVVGSAIAWYRSQNNVWKTVAAHVFIVAGLLLLTLSMAAGSRSYARGLADKWVEPLQPNRLPVNIKDSFCKPHAPEYTAADRRIEAQYGEITGRIQHHLGLTVFFYSNYFSAISMVMFFASVAGICLFYMANKGWKEANPFVVTVFVYATVTTAYFGSLVTVFQQQQNIADNKALYLKYVALGNSVLTYCATGQDGPTSGNSLAYVSAVDKDMAELNNIAVGFDYGKVPTSDVIFKNLSQKGAPSSPPEPGAGQAAGAKRVAKDQPNVKATAAGQ